MSKYEDSKVVFEHLKKTKHIRMSYPGDDDVWVIIANREHADLLLKNDITIIRSEAGPVLMCPETFQMVSLLKLTIKRSSIRKNENSE